MANYATLKAAIQDVIKENHANEIDGLDLQQTLIAMVNSLGVVGYQFVGVAIPTTNPGTPDQNVFYIASTDGVYPNFGGISLDNGEVAILKYNGSWTKETTGAASLKSAYPYALTAADVTPRIKELYLTGLNPSKKYYFKLLRWYPTGGYIQMRLYEYTQDDFSDEVLACQIVTEDNTKHNGLVRLEHSAYAAVDGYAIIDIQTSDTTNVSPKINPTYCSIPEYSPAIYAYLLGRAINEKINAGYLYKGIAISTTNPGTPLSPSFYFAITPGIYTNFNAIEVTIREALCVLSYDGTSWSKSVLIKQDLIIWDKTNALPGYPKGFIMYDTGAITPRSSGFETWVYPAKAIKHIKVRVGSNADTTAAIAFYSTKEISPDSYIQAASVQSISGYNWYETENIPQNAEIVAFFNRNATTPESSAVVEIIVNDVKEDVRVIQNEVQELAGNVAQTQSEVEELANEVRGETLDNVTLENGGYSGAGAPYALSNRVRINRIIAKSEAPFTINVPENCNGRIYSVLFYTGTDYTSFDHGTNYYQTNPNVLEITPELIGNFAGIAIQFCPKNNLTDDITIADLAGTRFIVSEGVVDDIAQLRNDVDIIEASVKAIGNAEYYGHVQTLKITDEMHKLTSRLVCAHYFDEYPYTAKNQSMAIWDGKAFCFNDTNFDDGFCVVIDIVTGQVLSRITGVPSVVAPPMASHLNTADFTDQYYSPMDKYPLLLLSRGDYAGSDVNKLCMYVFRITEPTTNNFVFTLVKTINVHNVPLAIFNPSWNYDANRRMIWGHLSTQDWRWNDSDSRKFNGQGLYFAAPGTEYICVASDDTAQIGATITITVGSVVRQVEVVPGGAINEIFAYVPYASGCSFVSCNQSANAFTGQYRVFACDSNGNKRRELKYNCAIQGFPTPELTDPETVTIGPSDMTEPVYIDNGIYQGGASANGKLFLPFQDYATINKQPTDYTGHCCLVVNPTSGHIESVIKTDIMENEGCAIWNGKLYVSSHRGNATGHTISFNIMEYSFE